MRKSTADVRPLSEVHGMLLPAVAKRASARAVGSGVIMTKKGRNKYESCGSLLERHGEHSRHGGTGVRRQDEPYCRMEYAETKAAVCLASGSSGDRAQRPHLVRTPLLLSDLMPLHRAWLSLRTALRADPSEGRFFDKVRYARKKRMKQRYFVFYKTPICVILVYVPKSQNDFVRRAL